MKSDTKKYSISFPIMNTGNTFGNLIPTDNSFLLLSLTYMFALKSLSVTTDPYHREPCVIVCCVLFTDVNFVLYSVYFQYWKFYVDKYLFIWQSIRNKNTNSEIIATHIYPDWKYPKFHKATILSTEDSRWLEFVLWLEFVFVWNLFSYYNNDNVCEWVLKAVTSLSSYIWMLIIMLWHISET